MQSEAALGPYEPFGFVTIADGFTGSRLLPQKEKNIQMKQGFWIIFDNCMKLPDKSDTTNKLSISGQW